MSEKALRAKWREELIDLQTMIEPAKNEEIARRAIDIAWSCLEKAENQAMMLRIYQDKAKQKEATAEFFENRYHDVYKKGYIDASNSYRKLAKRGKWITTRTWEHDGEMYCNQCGSDAPTEGDYRQVKTNFCPNCGAKMEVEE